MTKKKRFMQLLRDQKIIKGKERHLIELWEVSKKIYRYLELEGGTCPDFDNFEKALFNLN